MNFFLNLARKKKSPLENKAASNDCLPYEKLLIVSFVLTHSLLLFRMSLLRYLASRLLAY